jgi:nucleotide-binding universal stress UspA family protein
MPHLPATEVPPMKSILVPVEYSASLSAQLETAFLAAAPFAAHIAGVAPRSDFSNYLIGAGAGVGATIPVALEDLQREEDERVQQARGAFRQFVQAHGIVWDDAATPQTQVTATWIEDINSGDSAVAQLARLYDISVLARPTADSPVARRQLLEAVLFESGRPILISPPEAPKSLGKRVMVAWNGSTETTRAISLAMAFLAKAEWVLVLTVEGGMVEGPSAEDVRRMLTRSGIAAEARTVKPEGRSTGQAILAEAERDDVDLVIKGAYTHSRLRQMIFGGATTHIINETTVPVFMAH